MDIDAEINAVDLKKESNNNTADIGEDNIKILSLRLMTNFNQSATVMLKRDVALVFERRVIINIGWVICRIQKRV